MLLAARALGRGGRATLTLTRQRRAAQGPADPRAVRRPRSRPARSPSSTRAMAPVDAVVSVVGAALTPEPAVSKGFTIERTYYTLDGKKVDLASATGGTSQLKQNERLVVVLKVEAPETGGRILLVDRLPAGLEIENPRLVDSGDVKTLGLAEDHGEAAAHRLPRRPLRCRLRLLRFERPAARTALCRQRRGEPASPRGCHGRLSRAGGDAGLVRAPGGDGRGHVPPRPLRPHRLRPPRGHGEGVTVVRSSDGHRIRLRSTPPGLALPLAGMAVGGEGSANRSTRAGSCTPPLSPPRQGEGNECARAPRRIIARAALAAVALLCRCWLAGTLAVIWQRMEPLPLGRAEALSVTVLDRNDRLLRAYTTADGRWRLPVEPKEVDRALSRHADGLRGQALPLAIAASTLCASAAPPGSSCATAASSPAARR